MVTIDRIAEKVLKNGLKVICLRKTGAPIVAVQVWYRTGSANEHPGVRGISHFVEHMMFRGSENVGPEEHARRINEVGGSCNAFTAEDITAFINAVPSEHLDLVLQLEADRMKWLTFDADILETERRVVVEEFHTYMNNPPAKAFLEFRSVFYRGQPYEVSPLGDLESIQGITVEDCRRYRDRWYTPDNAVMVVVGDVRSEDQVFSSVERWFGSIRKSPSNQKDRPCLSEANRKARPVWITDKVDFDVPMLITGYPATNSSDPNALALEILQTAVSMGETSRLHREIVRKDSVAVMAGGMNHLLRLSGISLFFAAFTPDIPVRRVNGALEKQIEIVRRDGISEEEFQKTKNAALSGRLQESYSAENVCRRLGYSETVDGDYRLWVRRLEALEKMNRESLIEAARSFWNKENRYALYLKPKRVKPALFVLGLFRRLFPGKKA